MRIQRLLFICVLGLGLAACGTPTITDTADTTADKEAAISKPGDTPEAEAPASAAPKKAVIGDTITLRGSDEKVRIAVKPTRVITDGRPPNEIAGPEAGKRLYGVQITIKNVGPETWADSLDAAVLDAEGQEFDASLFGEIAGLQRFGDSAVGAGDVRKGGIVFEVPKTAKITRLRVKLYNSFSGQEAEWAIPG